MPAFAGFVDLSEARLVAQGGVRLVYEHDDLPGMLIKVLKPELVGDDGQPAGRTRRFKLRRRLGAFRQTQREISEFLAFQAKRSNRVAQWPIAKLYGFVETDKGLGLVTQKLTAPDGQLAPTLAALVRANRFAATHRDALRRFFQELEDRHICMCDMHPRNLVFVGNEAEAGRFVAVDGVGAKTLVPVRDWFRLVNTLRTRRTARKIWDFVERGGKAAARQVTADGLAVAKA